MISSLFQILIGFTGFVGVLLRFIGPITVAPTIMLVGLALFGVCSDYAGQQHLIYPLTKAWLYMFKIKPWCELMPQP